MNPLYLNALIGGIIIGLAALLFAWGLGRVMGVSGIVKWILAKVTKTEYWRYYFLVGLIWGVALYRYMEPSYYPSNTNPSYLIAGIAGILVGVGTSMANGCTSGHAVCGIGRLSLSAPSSPLSSSSRAVWSQYISLILSSNTYDKTYQYHLSHLRCPLWICPDTLWYDFSRSSARISRYRL